MRRADGVNDAVAELGNSHGFRSSFRDWAAEETEHPGARSSRRRWAHGRAEHGSIGGGSWTIGRPIFAGERRSADSAA